MRVPKIEKGESYPLAMAKIALCAEAKNFVEADERSDRSGDVRPRNAAQKRLEKAALCFAAIVNAEK